LAGAYDAAATPPNTTNTAVVLIGKRIVGFPERNAAN
jgi:hypothetical protein